MELKEPKCVVAIPCLNEEVTISKVVRDFREQMPEADVVVIDNNSVDKTVEKARQAGAKIISVEKRGKGNVVSTVFQKLDYDCYILVDGDDTYPPEAAREMVSIIQKGDADMVVADRVNEIGDGCFRKFHRFGNKLVNFLIKHLFVNFRTLLWRFLHLNKDFSVFWK